MAADARQAGILALVRGTYEEERVVARYTQVGLWPAEEILALEYLPDSGRVLDLGCGAGRTSIPLAEMGLEVVGVDLSQAMIQVAREVAQVSQVQVEFHCMDAMELDFADASFDAVLYSYNGMELLPGRAGKQRVLAQVRRVLRPGGHFVFCTHSLYAFNAFLPLRLKALLKWATGRLLGVPMRERELGERFIDDEDEEVKYLQILPPSAWIKMLEQSGLQVVYFNTRARLEAGRAWSLTGVWEDGERFYVARKK